MKKGTRNRHLARPARKLTREELEHASGSERQSGGAMPPIIPDCDFLLYQVKTFE